MASLTQIFAEVREDLEKSVKVSVPNTVETISGRQGKFSGELRASNNVAINTTDESVVTVANYTENAISGEVGLAKSNAIAVIQAFRLGDEVIISNNKDHAIYDEFKWGRLGFTGGADQFQSELDKAVAAI